ncbi:hypothetical protein KUTeg_017438 [Tegillarca granosa]|uniref:Carboxylic ester hydrolase n=1 Tax=Tegillarca granosa TaxID=220873 RepID=A0ABQ9EKD1_TEGGR|nr:hypothetical protein KUTeg_017438 [Tegillarca granosa]
MSEDCLYLNIYVPINTKKIASNMAVMVWIHGGAFTSGSGSASVYGGEEFAKKGNVIYVTINYRLGAFGFLKTGKGKHSAIGNYGFEDQRLALKWVKENIAAFGGDPKKVTVFGQSAGACSILLHLVSGKSAHLFDQAIIQSPPIAIQAKDKKAVEKQGKSFTKHLGCNHGDMSCLRNKGPEEVVVAQEKSGTESDNFFDLFTVWGPYVDGEDITHKAIRAAQNGILSPKPLIIGTNYHEGVTYVYETVTTTLPDFLFDYAIRVWRHCLGVPDKIKEPYKKMLCKHHDSEIIYKRFKPASNKDARPEFTDLVTEFVFTCPVRNISRNYETSNNVWMYVFNQTFPIPKLFEFSKCITHACHSVELPFLFQSLSKLGIPSFPSDGDIQLGNDMLTYWTNFAKYGNPNGKGKTKWPQYRQETDTYLHFQSTGSEVITKYRNNICNFFDKIGYD